MTSVVEELEKPKRNVFLRILSGILWFIPIHFLTNMTVGAVVGAIAGSSTGAYEAGYASGRAASIAFFQKFGLIVFIAESFLTAILSFQGVLPGTGKYKKGVKAPGSSMPTGRP